MVSSVLNSNGKSVSVTKTNNGTVKETTVKENGTTTKIHEDADGIAVTITEMKDGKEVSETTKAKDKDALKKDNPKIFEIYEKNSKDEMQIQGVPGQIRLRAGGNLEQHQLDMEKRMTRCRSARKSGLRVAEGKRRAA